MNLFFAYFSLGIILFSWIPARASQPDVIMIAVDDLRPMLGCYGDVRAKTPHIDRLAERGIVFDRAYCQYAKCGASRLSLMTGLRPDSINVYGHNDKPVAEFRKLRPDAVSIARWFKENGYHTRGLGKIHHDGWDLPSDWSAETFPGREQEMLEVYDEEKKSSVISDRWNCPVIQSPDVPDQALFAGRMTDEAIRILQEKPEKDASLFLAVGYRRPHLPFVAPLRYFDLHQPDSSWLANNQTPSSTIPVMAFFNSDGYVGGAKRIGLEMPNPPSRKEAPLWNGYEMRSYIGVPPNGEIDQKTQLDLIHAYAACVSYVDAQIGKLLYELEKSGRLDQAILVLWSDHGWHLGEHSAWGKMTNFEIATRVPLIISAPGMKSGRTKNLAELVDLYPTLCELAEIPQPKHLEGESLLPVLKNPDGVISDIALSQYARYKEQFMGRALRTERYRFAAWIDSKTGSIVERDLRPRQRSPGKS